MTGGEPGSIGRALGVLGRAAPPEAGVRAALAELRDELGAATYDSWMGRAAFDGVEDGVVRLMLPSAFVVDWVENHFRQPLERLIVRHVAGARGLTLALAGSPGPAASASASAAAAVAPVPALDPRYRFDQFVVGKANELAWNAARALAADMAEPAGGPTAFNPLFLHGPTGLGKTHLMHAIGHEVVAARPRVRLLYLSAERFMTEFLTALRARDTFSFKARLRSADLLMVDDVQFIAGKESTQEEFFHTLNEVIAAGGRLVISADRSPQNLEGIEGRIQSRLAWGLVADLHPADYELRLNILAAKRGAEPVPDDVLAFLARHIAANVRELEGALHRVLAYARLSRRAIDVAFAREVLADTLRHHARRLTVEDIQRRVADHYRLRLADLVSERRQREIARPRQVAMYLAKQLTVRSFPDIGRRFGGRDHTTVMHAVKRIESLRRSDPDLDRDLEELQRLLGA